MVDVDESNWSLQGVHEASQRLAYQISAKI